MGSAFAIKNNNKVIASSTGLVEPPVLRVKLVEDDDSFRMFPYSCKKLPITIGRIVPPVDQRYSIENLGFGNLVSMYSQLILDFGETNFGV